MSMLFIMTHEKMLKFQNYQNTKLSRIHKHWYDLPNLTIVNTIKAVYEKLISKNNEIKVVIEK